MTTPEIDEFGEKFVKHVRDNAMRDCDVLLRREASSQMASRWKRLMAEPDGVVGVIPDVVDIALFWMLHAIDEGLLPLMFASETGRVVSLSDEGKGELGGWYFGSDGWRARHSQERYMDDPDEES